MVRPADRTVRGSNRGGARSYAHSPNSADEWHDLSKHLRAVAAQTAEFAAPFGARDAGYWLGLWHDLGML